METDPASVAFAALAEEYRRAGRFQEAVDVARTGLVQHPVYLSARVTLGRALVELGALDEARQEFELVLRTAPENLAAIRGLAEIHHRGGQTSEGAEHYQAALDEAAQGLSSGSHPASESSTAGSGAGAGSRSAPAGPPQIVPAPAAPAAAPAPAAPVSAAPDPALAGLERFLEAIVAARAAEGSAGR